MTNEAKPEWALYCDESGNTGKNFADRTQPLFIEAGWYIRHDEAAATAQNFENLEERESYNKTEIKGAKLLKSGKGRAFLRAVSEMMGRDAIPYFYLAEKRYAICAKIVESLFDPAYNPEVQNEELWDPEARQEIAQALYDGSEDLIYGFGAAYREKNADAVCANAQLWLDHFRAQRGGNHATRIAAACFKIWNTISPTGATLFTIESMSFKSVSSRRTSSSVQDGARQWSSKMAAPSRQGCARWHH